MHYFLVNPEFFFLVIFINYVNPESPHTFSYACLVYFCVNASGKHPEKPIIIGHNKKPHDFPNNWWWKKRRKKLKFIYLNLKLGLTFTFTLHVHIDDFEETCKELTELDLINKIY